MPYDKDENVMPYDKEKHETPHDSDNEYMFINVDFFLL